ncbi:hypothetical protein [Sphingomonas prati]|uniref:Uncharacterized protein n=1 Tax=Sphingomonas prati TaxID=1843237 RepID=A0A7W9BV05_9SPHN|nr:hypothetical protein [Sphingomonas prati]MBB5730626.1 hypothetical protein [Sphingomonas prati]GGE95534.1 hypothetical protein GCM10011404_30770 [Sphingomonas prati]
MFGRLVGWLGRHVVLYVALVVAIAAGLFAAPFVRQVIQETTPVQVAPPVLDHAVRMMAAEQQTAAEQFEARSRALRTQGLASLVKREQDLRAERAVLAGAISRARSTFALAVSDRNELMRNERRKLRVALIDQELSVIAAGRAAIASDQASRAAYFSLSVQQRLVDRTIPACNDAVRRTQAYEQRWRWQLRRWWESGEHKQLVSIRNKRCDVARAAISKRNQLRTVATARRDAQRAAQLAFVKTTMATDRISSASADLVKNAERARIDLQDWLPGKLRTWLQKAGLVTILQTAAMALALIIAMPFLIRLLCFFILAPLAMRRPAIRLRKAPISGEQIPLAAPSTTSVAVRLSAHEELLVRQDYLQTSSHTGAKSTQWFLDWRKPVTSFATGLTLLTRIRGIDEMTTISAVRDGLAEVTILTLPEGASCVLQPRALAAVVQPVHRHLRITRHWRLGSLNAWLTLQLRYLVFHGPARLVLRGGRGVRVELAEHGRVFGQDQLVGFSADLAYSVTRTETFWPYFLGREQLLKDRVMAGAGILIVEEAPLSARRGETRRGLEGMLDAGMKVFGM